MKTVIRYHDLENVAPLVGAWIERMRSGQRKDGEAVAPLVGAWIERNESFSKQSMYKVAPLVGAWIEILDIRLHLAM